MNFRKMQNRVTAGKSPVKMQNNTTCATNCHLVAQGWSAAIAVRGTRQSSKKTPRSILLLTLTHTLGEQERKWKASIKMDSLFCQSLRVDDSHLPAKMKGVTQRGRIRSSSPSRGRSPPGALAAAQRGSWRRDLPAGALGRACAKSRGETRAARAPGATGRSRLRATPWLLP